MFACVIYTIQGVLLPNTGKYGGSQHINMGLTAPCFPELGSKTPLSYKIFSKPKKKYVSVKFEEIFFLLN